MKRQIHPNSLKNLIPAKPGEVRNPKGKQKNTPELSRIAGAMLKETCPYDPKLTWAQYIAKRWLELASEKGDYFRELLERTEGKVTIPIEGNINAEVTFVIGQGYGESQSSIQPDKLNSKEFPQLGSGKGVILGSVRGREDNSSVQQGTKTQS